MDEFAGSPLVAGAGTLWPEATRAEFLWAIRDSSLPREVFNQWLVQDYLFAQGATSFLAIAVAKTPRPAQKVLLSGLTALDKELGWFEENAQKRALDLKASSPPHLQTLRRLSHSFSLHAAFRGACSPSYTASRCPICVLGVPLRRPGLTPSSLPAGRTPNSSATFGNC